MGHHTGNALNCITAFKVHGKGSLTDVLDFACSKHIWIFLLNYIQQSLQLGYYTGTCSVLPCCSLLNICISTLNDAMVPYTSSSLFIVFGTEACRPKYQTRSATAHSNKSLSPPSGLPLCDFASCFLPQIPIV